MTQVDLSKIGRRAGYVYLMLAPDGRYKIGESVNVKQRKIQLENEFGCKLVIVAQVLSHNRFDDEATLHSHFWNKRQEREWFIFDEKDLIEFYDYARLIEIPAKVLLEARSNR